LAELPKESPVACLARAGAQKTEYLLGPVGETLLPASREDFLAYALSFSEYPAPSRLRYFFNYRKKFSEWQYRSSRPVFYELLDGLTQTYNRLMKVGADLGRSPGKYFDVTEHHLETLDLQKRNAGAVTLLDRNHLEVSNSPPMRDRFNFSPLAFHEHFRSLFFLPDAIVISFGLQNVYYRYRDVRLKIFRNNFVTNEVPYGVRPIDYTWQYVNKNGGPDRRFNNNFQIPIIEITELDFHFSDGSQIHTAFTDASAVKNFGAALCELGARA
jgi:hypothetical protein